MQPEIYLGTILVEVNRWSSPEPSYRVSDHLPRFAADGFDGLEVMDRHLLEQPDEELRKLEGSPIPVRIFNSYAKFVSDEQEATKREQTAQMIRRLGVQGVKVGLGRDFDRKAECLDNMIAWAEGLPDGCRVLLEAHDGMIAGTPDEAKELFGPLPRDRFQIIIHPMAGPGYIAQWFDAVGERITHTHVSLRDADNQGIMLDREPDRVTAALDALQAHQYAGTYTLEFTEGIRTPDENFEDLYHCGLEDLRFLRSYFAERAN